MPVDRFFFFFLSGSPVHWFYVGKQRECHGFIICLPGFQGFNSDVFLTISFTCSTLGQLQPQLCYWALENPLIYFIQLQIYMSNMLVKFYGGGFWMMSATSTRPDVPKNMVTGCFEHVSAPGISFKCTGLSGFWLFAPFQKYAWNHRALQSENP